MSQGKGLALRRGINSRKEEKHLKIETPGYTGENGGPQLSNAIETAQ